MISASFHSEISVLRATVRCRSVCSARSRRLRGPRSVVWRSTAILPPRPESAASYRPAQTMDHRFRTGAAMEVLEMRLAGRGAVRDWTMTVRSSARSGAFLCPIAEGLSRLRPAAVLQLSSRKTKKSSPSPCSPSRAISPATPAVLPGARLRGGLFFDEPCQLKRR
jgi:hypothetical protein